MPHEERSKGRAMNEDQVVEAAEKETDILQAEAERARTEQRKAEALLQQEQETIRALEAVAAKHGYDMETGGCLTDWLEYMLQEFTKAQGTRDSFKKEWDKTLVENIELRAQIDHWKKKYNEKIFANE